MSYQHRTFERASYYTTHLKYFTMTEYAASSVFVVRLLKNEINIRAAWKNIKKREFRCFICVKMAKLPFTSSYLCTKTLAGFCIHAMDLPIRILL